MELPRALVSSMYLYYDGWTKLADEQWRIITALELDDTENQTWFPSKQPQFTAMQNTVYSTEELDVALEAIYAEMPDPI